MGDTKVRCTTCYNVFNTSKEEGETVICPMCDNSFAVKKVNIVSDIAQSITDFTTKIGTNIKEKITPETKKEDSVFEIIDGKKYDKELLRVAAELTEKKEEITLEGSKQLFTQISDYDDYTQIEKQTVAYIRKNYKFTPEANKWLRTEIRRWAQVRTRNEEVTDPTSSEFKSGKQISFVFTNLKDAYRWDNLRNDKPKTPSQWAGILLSIVFVLGLFSGIAYGIKWNNQDTQWNNEGLSAVHGSVIDTNGDAIEDVIVEANGKKTSTNPQGWYVIYDIVGDEVQITFTMEGYGTVTVWINIRSEGTNILDIELLEGNEQKYDYRKEVAEPWPPNYALAPIFMVASFVALMGSSAAILKQNFRMAVAGCLFGVISYGFLVGSILSVIALSLLLVDRKNFDN
ncbi:MAG: carboxypeptidase-like regulatory domain-containing protein [Candidatus Poseidoniia archaeon]|nr:carboxypeptidase-like regulatory domain-containing protein [Candidatus Poseidoniia archaeon]